ncbi:hypothetical protein SO802_002559 [Lithocarpus litseifolius]|uniref:Uncharacterized protein n=1 Tax=Lithocarpus litseifolius TaxID=425828 RepID=A0AAW2E1P4_9ROSI
MGWPFFTEDIGLNDKRKLGMKHGLSLKERMGVGLAIGCVATAVSAMVESKRRNAAMQEGLLNRPRAIVNMSAMWLVPQHCLHGIAEAFHAIGRIEFYYSQLPKSMSSLAMAFMALGSGMGNLLASLIVKIVDDVSKRGGNMVRVGDLEVGFTMRPWIANGFVPMRSVLGYGFTTMSGSDQGGVGRGRQGRDGRPS